MLKKSTSVSYRIAGMDCPLEEKLLREKLSVLPNVHSLQFDLANNVLTIEHSLEDTSILMRTIAGLGMQVMTDSTCKILFDHKAYRFILACVLALSAEVMGWCGMAIPLLAECLSIVAILIGGLSTYLQGWRFLLRGHLNINALISVVATGACLIHEFPEAAMTVTLYVLAERIEAKSVARTRHTIHSLMALSPTQAEVLDASGVWRLTSVSQIRPGAKIRLKPGECVPLDGVVINGYSTINRASITGETTPISIEPGFQLLAGSINQESEIEYLATADKDHSMLSKMLDNAESWQENRAPAERWIERFAKIYTPTILLLAIIFALIPPLFDGAWLSWFNRSLVLLVTACPCALVIAIPATIVSGLTLAMRHGILIKGGVFLEQGKLLDTLVFDKTGTLTLGKPSVSDYVPSKKTRIPLLKIAKALAQRSDHPFSKAIVDYQALSSDSPLVAKALLAVPGSGIQGDVGNTRYYLGSERWILSLGVSCKTFEKMLRSFKKQGKSIVLLSNAQSVLALFSLTDRIRPSSQSCLSRLHKMRIETLMLSGDNATNSKNIAQQVGIKHIKSDVLPHQKSKIIIKLIKKGHCVGMMGDGVNDVPALACANIGFAMAKTASEAGVSAADVVLMDDDLQKLPAFIFFSKYTMATLRQNVTSALGVKLLFIIATLLGYGAMWTAVVADMGTNLLVTANGLKILRKRLPDFLKTS